MSTCEQCRFWNRNGSPRDEAVGEDDYEPLPHRRCLNIIHGNGSGARMREAPAAVLDGSGYAASLWTAPSFGCNAFEQADRDVNDKVAFAGKAP